MERNNTELLRVTDLSVSHGSVPALKEVSLHICKNEFIALIGSNGAGKSTLLESVIGVCRASGGRILFLGEDITGKPTDKIVAAGISLCPEGRGILPRMTTLENLQLGSYHNRKGMGRSLSFVFDLFPVLAHRMKQVAGTLSGGQQQMLSIGRALMGEPRLLMLDEPSLGLAPIVVEELFGIIRGLCKEGYTILLSEQNAKKALQYSHRAYIFETGRIVGNGPSNRLIGDSSVIDAYLGGNVC